MVFGRRFRLGSFESFYLILFAFIVVRVLNIFCFDFGKATLPFVCRKGAHRHADCTTDELRWHIDKCHRFEILFDLLHHQHTKILVSVFTATELKLDFEFVSLVEEFLGVAQLRLVIVRSDLHTELNLFDLRRAVLALFFFFGQLILELAKVCNAADGRVGCRGNLNKVKAV